ncbi:transposase [uncultured Legionella sp.]
MIKPHLPPEKDRGRPKTTDLRKVVNTLLYMLCTGCQRDLPLKSPQINGL